MNFNIVFVFQCQESQDSGTFGQKRPKVCRIFNHNSFSANLRVLGIKTQVFFLINFILVFVFQCQESQERGTFSQKRQNVCRIFHHNSFSAHLRVLKLKTTQVFLKIFNLVFVFQCQESQESGTFGQKRLKVCRLFHHNSFSANLRVLGIKTTHVFF